MGTFFISGLVLMTVLVSVAIADQEPRSEPALMWEQCSKPPVEPCFTHRGRLSAQNGIAYMLWLVGTKRIVAVDNGEMPRILWKYLHMTSPDHSDVYGDYEICFLESDQRGHMRRVCISGATRLVVQDRDRLRPPVSVTCHVAEDAQEVTARPNKRLHPTAATSASKRVESESRGRRG
jgi:hypothetical protein